MDKVKCVYAVCGEPIGGFGVSGTVFMWMGPDDVKPGDMITVPSRCGDGLEYAMVIRVLLYDRADAERLMQANPTDDWDTEDA